MGKKLTDQRLLNSALFRLAKAPKSVAALRFALTRRVRTLLREGATLEGEPEAAVQRIIDRLLAAGLLDDQRLATLWTESLRRGGSSQRRVARKLVQARLPSDVVKAALAADEANDESTVWRWAQRKRLGVFRLNDRAARRERDLAALVRAGFSFRLARAVVDASSAPDE